jgi:predicted Holliday junction resolvase-like endonuclease
MKNASRFIVMISLLLLIILQQFRINSLQRQMFSVRQDMNEALKSLSESLKNNTSSIKSLTEVADVHNRMFKVVLSRIK